MDDTEEMLQASRKLLKFFRMSPEEKIKFGIYELLRYMTLLLSFSVPFLTSFLHLIHNKSQNTITLKETIEDITNILTVASFYFLIFNFLTNHEKITKFYNDVMNFEKFKRPPNLHVINRYLNVLCIVYSGFGVVGTVVYYILKITLDKTCEENNKKYDRNDLCGYLTPTWLPFSINQPYSAILIVLQIYAIAAPSGLTICSNFVFCIGCSEVIIAKIKHLNEILRNISDIQDYETSKRQLNFCVEYHNNIITLVDKYNECYGTFFFLYCGDIGMVIAMTGFSFMIEPNIPILLLLVGFMFAIIITCVSGQRLMNESLTICDAAYEINWYDLDKSMQMTIKMIILRAQTPLRQRAWKVADISFETLKEVLKTSYSALALLNRMYNTEGF